MKKLLEGWDATAYGQRLKHYFREDETKAICKTRAIFPANPERHFFPYGQCCTRCLTILYTKAKVK